MKIDINNFLRGFQIEHSSVMIPPRHHFLSGFLLPYFFLFFLLLYLSFFRFIILCLFPSSLFLSLFFLKRLSPPLLHWDILYPCPSLFPLRLRGFGWPAYILSFFHTKTFFFSHISCSFCGLSLDHLLSIMRQYGSCE